MKEKLTEYLPPFYKDCLLDQLSRLCQESLLVKEYMTRFMIWLLGVISIRTPNRFFLGFALAWD